MSGEIALTKGLIAIVDAADLDWLRQWKWCAMAGGPGHGGAYAVRFDGPSGHRRLIRMHREIVRPPARGRRSHNWRSLRAEGGSMIARVIWCIATPDGNRLIHCRLPEAAGVTDCTVGSPRPYRPDTEISVRREGDRWALAEPAET